MFRPSVRVTSPDGRRWEIYAYRLERPATPRRRLLARLVDTAAAAMRALRSDVWTVEAVTFMPQPQSYVWKTTREHRGQVLAQVEGGLARGEPPQQLRNATYAGWRRSAR